MRLPLLITAATRALLPAETHVRRLGKVHLAGITEPEILYELKGEHATPEWEALRDRYEAALAQYESQRWLEASHSLQSVVGAVENQRECDGPAVALLDRARECLVNRPESFEAIVEVCGK